MKEDLTKWHKGAATYSHIVFNILGDISSTLAEGLLCIAPIILFISSSQTGREKLKGC